MATLSRVLLGSALAVLLMAALLGVVTADRVRPDDHPSWSAQARKVDDALRAQDLDAARRMWREAYSSALRSQRWDALVEAGDGYLRIGEAMGARAAAEPQAREAYLRAMVRARADGSVDGVLRASAAFAALGDREVAAQGAWIAERLALQGDAPARERVRTFSQELAVTVQALGSGIDLF